MVVDDGPALDDRVCHLPAPYEDGHRRHGMHGCRGRRPIVDQGVAELPVSASTATLRLAGSRNPHTTFTH